MVVSKQFEENLKERFVEIMLIRYRYQNQKKFQKLDENGGSKIYLFLIRFIVEIGRKSFELRGFYKYGNKYKDRILFNDNRIIYFQYFLLIEVDCIEYNVFILIGFIYK